MGLCIIVFLLAINAIVECQNGMSFLGLPIEGFGPCPDVDLFMEHLIGLPPDEENYWNGTFMLEKYPNIPEVRLWMQLDNEAVITIDRKVGRVHNMGINQFSFQLYKHPPELETIKFHVQGGEGKPFPNVESFQLNGLELCTDPKKWSPIILGDASVASPKPIPLSTNTGPQCGYRKVTHKELIIEGQVSKAGDWPWHAALYKYNLNKNAREYICGGSLLSTSIVLTAAHCVTENGRSVLPDRLLVGLGKYNLIGSDLGLQELTVYEVIVHPAFNASSLRNDIALLKLSTEAIFTSYVQPICLWNPDLNPEIELRNIVNTPGTVVGWGRWGFGTNEILSTKLQQGTMPVVSVTTCLTSFPDFFSLFLTDYSFCAGYRNGTSVCNGDSGGGMYFSRQVDNELQWHIRGLVSLSVAKDDVAVCDPLHYVIFTDVGRYVDWINPYLIKK